MNATRNPVVAAVADASDEMMALDQASPNPAPVATTAEDAQEVAAVRAPVAVATSDADLPDSGDLHGLRAHFWARHRECEKAAYALASALPVGDERSRVFDLYEIIRTAPREAQS